MYEYVFTLYMCTCMSLFRPEASITKTVKLINSDEPLNASNSEIWGKNSTAENKDGTFQNYCLPALMMIEHTLNNTLKMSSFFHVNQHEQQPEAEDNSCKDEESCSDDETGSGVENEEEQVEEGGDNEDDGSSCNEDAESIRSSDREDAIMQEYTGNDAKKLHQSFDTHTEQEEGNVKYHSSDDTSEMSSSSSPIRPLLSPLQSQTGDDSSHENMQNLDNSIHSVDSEIAAMQSRIGNTHSPQNRRGARSRNKAGTSECKKASTKQSKVTRSNSSPSIRNRAKDQPNEENNPKRKKGKKKEESNRKSLEILNEESETFEKSSSTANKRSESAPLTKAKALTEKRKAKCPDKEITADDYFIDISDDNEDLEARKNRSPTPPPDVLQKRKGKERTTGVSKPTQLPQPNLYPPKQRDRKRKTVAQVAEERAQEVSEMNKRRVTALENIGNGLSMVSKKRATGEMSQSATLKKPVAIATRAVSMESLDDEDEVSMWGKILMKNIKDLDSNIVREDLMDHMMSLVRQAKRGSWPNQYSTPPRTQFTNICHLPSPLLHRSPITPLTPSRPQCSLLGATASGAIANHPRAVTPPVTPNMPHLPEQPHQHQQQHLQQQHQQHQPHHQQQQVQQQQPHQQPYQQQQQQLPHQQQHQQYKLQHQQQQYQQQSHQLGHQQKQSIQSLQELPQETDHHAQQMMNMHHALPQPLNTNTNGQNGLYQQNVQGPCNQGNTMYAEGQPQYTTL